MDWIIENWGLIVALAFVGIGAVVAVLKIVKPGSRWLHVLIYILGIIEDLAPELAKQVKLQVKSKMSSLPAAEQQALQDAVATVDPKKVTPASVKRVP